MPGPSADGAGEGWGRGEGGRGGGGNRSDGDINWGGDVSRYDTKGPTYYTKPQVKRTKHGLQRLDEALKDKTEDPNILGKARKYSTRVATNVNNR